MTENVRQKEDQGLSAIFKSDLFSTLLPGEKKSVLGRTGIITLVKGSTLFCQGDKAEHLYLLREGLIRIFKPLEGGGDEEIARFAPGDIIGDFDFARRAKYDAQAEALENSTLIMFPSAGITLDSFTLEMPHIVSRLLLNSAAMVTGRIKSTRKLIIKNMSWVQELSRTAYEDPGTGLWKQTFLTDEIDRLLEDPMAFITLKPDRFKVLVDALGHDAGDKAMVKIAAILKDYTNKLGRGWAIRFKSNETGLLVNKCNATQAESLALSLQEAVAALAPVPLGQEGEFNFSGSIAWGIWPEDNEYWASFFDGVYGLLMDTWKTGGNRIARYQRRPSL
ncbi:MAG: cyclic nucleotide-binding domain-containing protein [Treponema sp.]|nr:cyclic nucleotide-binding domain-containing protein [Treponema sp.]